MFTSPEQGFTNGLLGIKGIFKGKVIGKEGNSLQF